MGSTVNDTLITLLAKGSSTNVGLVSYSIPPWDPLHTASPPPADIIGLSGGGGAGTGDPRRFIDDFASLWPDLTAFLQLIYWTIQADLGQQNPNNVLVNQEKLKLLAAPVGDGKIVVGGGGIQGARVLTSFLCQGGKLKSPLSLIVSVVVADLVLLSSGWTVLTIVSAWLAKKRNHDGTSHPSLFTYTSPPF
jgi:hypothetical protein